jgi:CRISPR-associated protein Cas6
MFWNQTETPDAIDVPDDIVDLLFALDCRRLPVDHAYDLSEALVSVCPWMVDEPGLAIHAIHVADSQNGWERPAHVAGNHLQVSRRTRLRVRVPQARVRELLEVLPGTQIEVGGCSLKLGPGKVKSLSKETTLFARYVVAAPGQCPVAGEDDFLQAMALALAEIDIRLRKAMCGKTVALATPQGEILVRSLLVADLSTVESIRLQQHGLGSHRLMCCGIFIPHKGIDAVNKHG